jgi:DNA repair protein RecO (recombination protein O)
MERHRAIILGRQTFSNTSLVLSVWSRRIGWMEVTARGMMRSKNNRLGDVADEFDVSEIVVYRKANSLYSILVEHDLIAPGTALRADWVKYGAMAMIRDLLGDIWRGYPADEDDAWRVYSVLVELLGAAEHMDGIILGVAGVMRVLDAAGVAPQLEQCPVCSKTTSLDGWILSWREGGLVCRDCATNQGRSPEGPIIDEGLAGVLRRVATMRIDALTPLRAPSVGRAARLLAALAVWCQGVMDSRTRAFSWLGTALEGIRR